MTSSPNNISFFSFYALPSMRRSNFFLDQFCEFVRSGRKRRKSKTSGLCSYGTESRGNPQPRSQRCESCLLCHPRRLPRRRLRLLALMSLCPHYLTTSLQPHLLILYITH